MIREDYLVKMIRRAAAAIARALDLVQQEEPQPGQEQQSVEALDEALRLLIKMPRDMVARLEPKALLEHLDDAQGARSMAAAFRVEGLWCEKRGETKRALRHYQRAMQLLLAVGIGESSADKQLAAAILASTQRLRPGSG